MRNTHNDTDPTLVPCGVRLSLLLLHTPASDSAPLLLILMPPLPQVHHHKSYGNMTGFFSVITLLGVRHLCILQALLVYVIYGYSTGFSNAGRVLVIGDADCEPSTIQSKKKGALSVMLQHVAERVPIFRRLIDNTHAQRITLRPGSCLVCRAAVPTAESTPSVVRVAIFRGLLDDVSFLQNLSMLLPYEYLFSGGWSTPHFDLRIQNENIKHVYVCLPCTE